MATIKDIAEKSGYSIATVSRVLNNQRNVDRKIQDEIFACAKELDYKPNVLGQLLRTQNSKLIMCMIPNSMDGLMFEIFAAMQQTLHDRGYQLLLCPVDPAAFQEKSDPQVLSLLESGLIGGIVFGHSFLSTEELMRLNQRHPLIQMMEYNDAAKTSVVTLDYMDAMREAVLFLAANGHRRIGVVSFLPNLLSSRKKLLGYKVALEEAGLDYDPDLIVQIDVAQPESTSSVLHSLMTRKDRPSALVCFSDNIAVQCILTLNKMRLSVPEDCSIMGFDHSSLAEICVPPLTTVGAESLHSIGRRTVLALLDQIESGEKNNEKIIIPHRLFERNSVKAV